MSTFNYKKRNFFSLSPHLLGLLFIGVGLFILISPTFIASENSLTKVMLVGSANVLFGLIVVFSYSGVLINFDNKQYQEYYNLCGYKFGELKTLPAILLVKSMAKQHVVTSLSNGVNPTMRGLATAYYVFLYTNRTKPYLVFEYNKKEESERAARELSGACQASLELQA
jgi:hypothetical protein